MRFYCPKRLTYYCIYCIINLIERKAVRAVKLYDLLLFFGKIIKHLINGGRE